MGKGKGANLAMGLNPHTLCSDTHLDSQGSPRL